MVEKTIEIIVEKTGKIMLKTHTSNTYLEEIPFDNKESQYLEKSHT